MNQDKILNLLLTKFSKFCEFQKIKNIAITESEIDFRPEKNIIPNQLWEIIWFFIIVLPPLCLVFYTENKLNYIFALFWFTLYSYTLIKIIRYENKVKIKIFEQFVLIEKGDSLSRYFFRSKKIKFNQIKEFEIEYYNTTRYGSGYTGIILITIEGKMKRLVSFENQWMAEETKKILNRIIHTEPNITLDTAGGSV